MPLLIGTTDLEIDYFANIWKEVLDGLSDPSRQQTLRFADPGPTPPEPDDYDLIKREVKAGIISEDFPQPRITDFYIDHLVRRMQDTLYKLHATGLDEARLVVGLNKGGGLMKAVRDRFKMDDERANLIISQHDDHHS